ncbi:MAG TPA: putative glycoside hydrolase [Methylomirabilota bacterium]|jgi:hypothetical protein|nr:putative glycoside hydrolase [Methylomirabilota bacterium]
MLEAPIGPEARHSAVFDVTYTVGLLAIAILTGYAVLAPWHAAPVTAALPPAVVGSIAARTATAPGDALAPTDALSEPPATRPGAQTPTGARSGSRSEPASAMVARSVPDASRPPAIVRPAPEPARPEPARPERPRGTWSGAVSGRVLDQDGQPLTGVSVVAAGTETRAAEDGTFTVMPPSDATLIVKRPGFAKVTIEPTPIRGPLEIVMRTQTIRAAYLTYFGFGDRGIRNRVLDLVARTELNAVVIDVKGDRGWIIYPTRVEQALAIGAQGPATLRDFDGMMADLKARGVYTIARIVTFKDNVLATARPDLAVVDTRTGKPWVDRENLAWVDPFREEVWDYNIAIAKEAIERGFDEVQFDYVRFPTDGKLAAARYARPVSKETRLPTIVAFLERARKELGARGAYVAADLFGYTAFNENDTDIGQRIEELAPHLDYICPMVYPSGYHVGIPGYRNPVENSYAVVRESVRLIRRRAAHTPARVRPWLQDFKDYAFDRRTFGVTEIREQIRGSDEGGGAGWMLWNPRNDYTGAALRIKLAAR